MKHKLKKNEIKSLFLQNSNLLLKGKLFVKIISFEISSLLHKNLFFHNLRIQLKVCYEFKRS